MHMKTSVQDLSILIPSFKSLGVLFFSSFYEGNKTLKVNYSLLNVFVSVAGVTRAHILMK
jgi:hypothetical protein